MKKYGPFLFAGILMFSACSIHPIPADKVITEELAVREKAYQTALLYLEADTEYAWGGQDPLRTIQLDCSGLVVMCYTYAVEDSIFSLPFYDAASYDLYLKYSTPTDDPVRGDVIFMGDTETSTVNHVAVFEKEENNIIYFIDSTRRDLDGDGIYEVDGVTRRSYHKDRSPIIGFGLINLVK
ncbi:MAG TPA: NlpC/P60 family protein [Treponemataceae bacterium]|nr:NlpC/P60 family protein [Treponemataceae bacterium]